MSRGLYSLQGKFMHSCIKKFINVRKKNVTNSHTTKQADTLPLRYVTVMKRVGR